MTDPRYEYRLDMASGATPEHLVVLLYEQLIHDLHRAVAAMEENNIEKRTHELSHAMQVLGELQARLDLQQGGQVAANLDRYYSIVRNCVLKAQCTGQKDILQAQIAQLLGLREAWLEVEHHVHAPVQPTVSGEAVTSNQNDVRRALDWKA